MALHKKTILILILGFLIVHSIILTETLGWGQISYPMRDPFSLPKGIYNSSKEPITQKVKKLESIPEVKSQEIKPKEAQWTLKAILIGEYTRLASINQRILTIGDEINGEKILEIHSDRIVLGKGTERRTVLLDKNPLKIKVE